ncbi:hypothetical protein GALMADRAFT_136357 [Galerina marginata CBS 339.88]|uniref:Uncharacterized protein n=1 Tax=Galerina marginata (strain CBS 339.88) TaxID=685588 RepID=A0A067T9B9_GALM3|nr:hypothetical protein GALMADRAFT_136357 [Galerina marginata CBS 339.88]
MVEPLYVATVRHQPPRSRLLPHSDIIRSSSSLKLVLSALRACTGILGWTGLLTNNRFFLALYTLLIQIRVIFPSILIPGYLTCKHRLSNLEGERSLNL